MMNHSRCTTFGLAALAITAVAGSANALEYPIGEPVLANGMEIAAVYLQPIEMEPAGMMRPAAESDIHIEADIHALADSPHGLAEGDWVPYLNIHYTLTNTASGATVSGMMMQMVASDGAHYGDNVDLPDVGPYTLRLEITPPGAEFGRHVDDETGVAPWFAPFAVDYSFVFAGTGKRGGY